MTQMLVLIPLEFFNSIFLNVIVLSGIGIKIDKDPLKWRLLFVTIVTLVVGVVLSNYTPVFPRYLMGASIIILLFCATACNNLSKTVKISHAEIIIFVVITLIFTWMALPNFESHYWIEQYTC
jgi:predicted nucleic acid-binding Zn ribbon protein